jgi:hypothetical protein
MTRDAITVSPETPLKEAAEVKAFNTTFAPTLVAGEVAGQQLDVLIAGDDDEAKTRVAETDESGKSACTSSADDVPAGVASRSHVCVSTGLVMSTTTLPRRRSAYVCTASLSSGSKPRARRRPSKGRALLEHAR